MLERRAKEVAKRKIRQHHCTVFRSSSTIAVVQSRDVREFVSSYKKLIGSSEVYKNDIGKSVIWIRNMGLHSQHQRMKALVNAAKSKADQKRTLVRSRDHENELKSKKRKVSGISQTSHSSVVNLPTDALGIIQRLRTI